MAVSTSCSPGTPAESSVIGGKDAGAAASGPRSPWLSVAPERWAWRSSWLLCWGGDGCSPSRSLWRDAMRKGPNRPPPVTRPCRSCHRLHRSSRGWVGPWGRSSGRAWTGSTGASGQGCGSDPGRPPPHPARAPLLQALLLSHVRIRQQRLCPGRGAVCREALCSQPCKSGLLRGVGV